jgi:glycosyltransferase involved in cell wall biosynthesis
MKISLYIYNPYPSIGGGDKTLARFINSINFKKFEVTYLSLKYSAKISKKINYIKLNSKSTFWSFIEIKKIIVNDKSEKKIFFSMQYFVNVPALIFLKKIYNLKFFIYEINHPNELNYSRDWIDFLKKKIIKFLVKRIYYKADIVAANCKELSFELSHLIKKKVETIYNPCFFKIIHSKKKKLNNQNINILNVARFEHQKDQLTLLKAIEIAKYKSRINLSLVGFGTKEKILTDFIKKNEIQCKIYKNSTKLTPFYKNNDLFILTSLYEGLPTVLIEAASHCMPIISSKFKSGSKEILRDGKCGHLFEIQDYLSLSKIIDRFVKDPKPFYKKEKLCRQNLIKFSNKENIKRFNTFLLKLSN